ncbi:uncharacterized protein LOC135342654 isoform X3 [Halichondria panicea]|uniref:uncharacterized protein LOC135342654 isoform X3 n=1 Tax=Halichondria panicea TaxID=6063 RepID=UPI00312BA60F
MTSLTSSTTTTQLELCRGALNVANLGFVACLGVMVPAAGFTLILMVILICCAGICICWRKKTKRKVAQSVAQTEMDHTSDRSNAQVVRLKRRKVHQYEDVENPRPDEHTEEPVSDRERTHTDGDKMVDDEYSELEHQAETNALQKINLEGDQGEPHMYEMVLAVSQDKDKTAVNTKQQLQIESLQYYEDVCDNKLPKQPQSSFDSFSTSCSSQNQYNVLDHSLVTNPGQKATIKAITSEDSMEDHRYSRTHAHTLTLMGNSVEETSQDNQYENLGSRVVKSAQRQNTLANESSGSCTCEYHVLEEAVSNGTTIPTTSNQPEQTPPIPKHKSNTTVPAYGVLNYNDSSQQNIKIQDQPLHQSIIEESKERVFDDPQYNILPTAPKVLEDEAEHRREATQIQTFPFDELTDVHEVWIHND